MSFVQATTGTQCISGWSQHVTYCVHKQPVHDCCCVIITAAVLGLHAVSARHHQMSKDTILAVNVVCAITASIQHACPRHKQDSAVSNDCSKQFTMFTGNLKSIQHVSVVDAVHMHAVLMTNLHRHLHGRHACAYCCHHRLDCHLHSCNCTFGMNHTHLG